MKTSIKPGPQQGNFGLVDAIRGFIITVVIGVVGYFVLMPAPETGQGRPPMSSTGIWMMVIGIGLQVAILFGRPMLAKYERAHGLEGQISPIAVHIAQLVADGVTVLLFALAVFGNIAHSASDI